MGKKRWIRVVLALLLTMMMSLTACGGKEPSEADPNPGAASSPPETEPSPGAGAASAPASEAGWFDLLGKLTRMTVIERSDSWGSMVEDGTFEIVIDKIHPGSFSQREANEIFLDCRIDVMPHVGGLDSRAGILVDADTLEVIAYKEFRGDTVILEYLQTANGQTRILSLIEGAGQGYRMQNVGIWGMKDGQWAEFPTGIGDYIPDEKKGDIYEGVNGPERELEDSFCYVFGNQLAVTYEQDDLEMFFSGERVPSELVAILTWNPYKERFEPETSVEQPAGFDISQAN